MLPIPSFSPCSSGLENAQHWIGEAFVMEPPQMSYRSLALATAVAASSWMLIASAAAQSVYVAPGGVYVAPGAGPVYVTPPPGAINRPAAYVEPGPAYGGTVAYVETGYDEGYAPVAYA